MDLFSLRARPRPLRQYPSRPSDDPHFLAVITHFQHQRWREALAVLRAHPEAVSTKRLVADKTQEGFFLLHLAIRIHAPAELTLELIDANPEAVRDADNYYGLTPLNLCADSGFAEYPNMDDHGVMMVADFRVLDRLLSMFPEAMTIGCKNFGTTPLLNVLDGRDAYRYDAALRMLAACPQAAGVADKIGRVPLHFAVGLNAGRLEMKVAKELLRVAPHTLSAKTAGGWTAIHFACTNPSVTGDGRGFFVWLSANSIESALWLLCKMEPAEVMQRITGSPHAPRGAVGRESRSLARELSRWRASQPFRAQLWGSIGGLLAHEVQHAFHASTFAMQRLMAFSFCLNALYILTAPDVEVAAPYLDSDSESVDSLFLFDDSDSDSEPEPGSSRPSLPFSPRLWFMNSIWRALYDRRPVYDEPERDPLVKRCWELVSTYATEKLAAEQAMATLLLCLQGAERQADAAVAFREKMSPNKDAMGLRVTRRTSKVLRAPEGTQPSPLIRGLGALEVTTREVLLKKMHQHLVPDLNTLFRTLLRDTMFGSEGLGNSGLHASTREHYIKFMDDTWDCATEWVSPPPSPSSDFGF